MVDAIKTPGVPASKHQVARSLLSTAQALYLEAKASAESRFGDSAKAVRHHFPRSLRFPYLSIGL